MTKSECSEYKMLNANLWRFLSSLYMCLNTEPQVVRMLRSGVGVFYSLELHITSMHLSIASIYFSPNDSFILLLKLLPFSESYFRVYTL